MSTPSSHAGYRAIAQKALHPTTGVPGLSDWEVFLHGFTDTNMRGDSRRIYDCLINLFPTPESLTEWPTVKDAKGRKVPKYELPNTGGCENLQSRVNAGKWLVHNGDNWARIAPLLRCKTEESQVELRDLDKTGKRGAKINQNRLLQKEMKGAGLKGADMHLLWGGCEVPVIDIQLIRYMAPQVLGEPWRDWVVDLLQARKDAGEPLLVNPGMPAELQVWIPASEIDINKRTHISGEEKAQQSLIQRNPGRYGEWRDAAYRMADAEGLKANKWHVANWLEAREGGDPDKPETQTRGVTDTERLESVKKFSEYTFGPTNFPDAPATWPLPPERYQDKSGLKPSAYGDEAPGTPEWFKEQISLVMRGQTGQSLSTEQALNMLRQIRSEVTGLLRFKPGIGEDVEQYPTIEATAERRSWEFVVELIDQHVDSLEGFGDEPSREEEPSMGSFTDLSGLSRYASDIEALVG